MRNVYVVRGESGNYPDNTNTWDVLAFSTLRAANEHAGNALTWAANEHRRWSEAVERHAEKYRASGTAFYEQIGGKKAEHFCNTCNQRPRASPWDESADFRENLRDDIRYFVSDVQMKE